MPIQYAIGLGAGLVSAVVFVSATTGPLLARVLLFLITPLAVFLAGLGWRWTTAGIAAGVATLLIGLVAGAPAAGVFALSQGAPVVLLCYLASLNRIVPGDGSAQAVEWYPIGRIVVWTALFASGLSVLSMLMLGADTEQLHASLRAFIETTVKDQLPAGSEAQPLSEEELNTVTDIATRLMPAVSATTWMGGLLFNLWLAGRITLASGRLERPWPDLAATTYPPGTPLLLAAGILGSFFAGYVGIGGTALTGAFFLAYVLLGLAIIHYLTRGKSWRPFALWGLYLALFLLNTGLSLAIAVLGLAESFSPFRRQLPGEGGTPTRPFN